MALPKSDAGGLAGKAALPPAGTREGRDSTGSQDATRALLFARGRPRPWLLLLLACFAFVLASVFG